MPRPSPGNRSRFWEELGEQDRQSLDDAGFDSIKRHAALHYFTWRWNLTAAVRSPQLRFLLRHVPPKTWYRAWREADASGETWEHLDWSRRERKAYTFATRLLWAYAAEHGYAPALHLTEPLIGAPPPVEWEGRLISQDLANSALELAFMAPALEEPPQSFLEVGAGYGRTAYVLLSLFPSATYTIVDIEPAIDISRWYLGQLFPTERLRFLSPDETDSIGSIDVALSISSLHEMLPQAVKGYLDLFDRVASVAYLKQWTRWHNPADNLDMAFAAYPFPAGWQRLRWSAAPVQTDFTEALFAIPRS